MKLVARNLSALILTDSLVISNAILIENVLDIYGIAVHSIGKGGNMLKLNRRCLPLILMAMVSILSGCEKDDAKTSATITGSSSSPIPGTMTADSSMTGMIMLSWSGFSTGNGGVNGYTLVYNTGTPPTSCSSGTQIYNSTGTSYDHTGVTSGTTYYYRLCAKYNSWTSTIDITATATAK